HTRWPRDWSSDVCSSDLRRLEREHGRKNLVLLGQKRSASMRQVSLGPLFVLRELAAQTLPVVQTLVRPEVDVLVQRPELRRPATLELAVLVAADLAPDFGGVLEVLALRARLERVGAKLVDHDEAPLPV